MTGHSAAVEVVMARIDDKPVLQSLLELYQYDLSRFDKRVIGPSGQYGYRYLDHYWTDPERHPYLVRIDGQWAGFVLVNRHSPLGEPVWSVAEFFIMAAYRRSGYGESVAHRVFDQHPGTWHIAVEASNIAGQRFWRTVVERYTNGRFDECQVEDDRWQGPVLVFDSEQSR